MNHIDYQYNIEIKVIEKLKLIKENSINGFKAFIGEDLNQLYLHNQINTFFNDIIEGDNFVIKQSINNEHWFLIEILYKDSNNEMYLACFDNNPTKEELIQFNDYCSFYFSLNIGTILNNILSGKNLYFSGNYYDSEITISYFFSDNDIYFEYIDNIKSLNRNTIRFSLPINIKSKTNDFLECKKTIETNYFNLDLNNFSKPLEEYTFTEKAHEFAIFFLNYVKEELKNGDFLYYHSEYNKIKFKFQNNKLLSFKYNYSNLTDNIEFVKNKEFYVFRLFKQEVFKFHYDVKNNYGNIRLISQEENIEYNINFAPVKDKNDFHMEISQSFANKRKKISYVISSDFNSFNEFKNNCFSADVYLTDKGGDFYKYSKYFVAKMNEDFPILNVNNLSYGTGGHYYIDNFNIEKEHYSVHSILRINEKHYQDKDVIKPTNIERNINKNIIRKHYSEDMEKFSKEMDIPYLHEYLKEEDSDKFLELYELNND